MRSSSGLRPGYRRRRGGRGGSSGAISAHNSSETIHGGCSPLLTSRRNDPHIRSVTPNIIKLGPLSGDFSYDCKTQVDKASFLCTSSLDMSRQYYGSVALATVDMPAGTVTVKQVAPASKASRPVVLPASDQRRVAIYDSTGWYTTSLDGASSPTRQPLSDQQNLGDPLFWA